MTLGRWHPRSCSKRGMHGGRGSCVSSTVGFSGQSQCPGVSFPPPPAGLRPSARALPLVPRVLCLHLFHRGRGVVCTAAGGNSAVLSSQSEIKTRPWDCLSKRPDMLPWGFRNGEESARRTSSQAQTWAAASTGLEQAAALPGNKGASSRLPPHPFSSLGPRLHG